MSSDTRLRTGPRLCPRPLPRPTPLSLSSSYSDSHCLHACKVLKMAYLRLVCSAKAQTDWCSVFCASVSRCVCKCLQLPDEFCILNSVFPMITGDLVFEQSV